MGYVIFVILFFVVIGIIGGLPALLPPLRRRAREHDSFRLWLGLGLALLSILITVVMWARTWAEVAANLCNVEIEIRDIRDVECPIALRNELTLRILFPPPMLHNCFSGDAAACAAADALFAGGTNWGIYLLPWALALISGVVTFIMVRRHTRDTSKQKRE